MKWLVTLNTIRFNAVPLNAVPLNAIPLRKKNDNKYLVFDDLDENKEVLKKYEEVWGVLKKKSKLLMVARKLNMGKIFKKLGLSLLMVCR